MPDRDKWSTPIPSCESCSDILRRNFSGKKLWEIGPFKGVEASKTAFAELQEKDQVRYEGLSLETKNGRRVEVEFVSNAYLVDERRFIQCNIRDRTRGNGRKNRCGFRNTLPTAL